MNYVLKARFDHGVKCCLLICLGKMIGQEVTVAKTKIPFSGANGGRLTSLISNDIMTPSWENPAYHVSLYYT